MTMLGPTPRDSHSVNLGQILGKRIFKIFHRIPRESEAGDHRARPARFSAGGEADRASFVRINACCVTDGHTLRLKQLKFVLTALKIRSLTFVLRRPWRISILL